MTPVAFIWLIKLLLSHLMTDFLLQPRAWVDDRKERHFRSPKLYLHGLVTAAAVTLLVGFQYWGTLLIIFVTHVLIDGWKSYQKETLPYFLADQALHFAVILGCWYANFLQPGNISSAWQSLNTYTGFWLIGTAFIFNTVPAGILIGQLTRQWRDKIKDAESLASAGKWIGITERVIVLSFVLLNQYAAIGLLVTAKGIIRFNEKDRPEIKTEYLVIGTLLSIGVAIVTGLLVKLVIL